jgi:hypothetical protein
LGEPAGRVKLAFADAGLAEFAVAYAGLPETPDKNFVHNIVLYMINAIYNSVKSG